MATSAVTVPPARSAPPSPSLERSPTRVTSPSSASTTGNTAKPELMSDDEIRERMSGNICRCGAYPNIVRRSPRRQHSSQRSDSFLGMNPFNYERATTPAVKPSTPVTMHGAKFLGGGTNLVDLMKYEVEHPTTLVDINHLDLTQVTSTPQTVASVIGALVRNSDLANHKLIRRASIPCSPRRCSAEPSPQLRNMATTGGNLLQRTRCYYFNDTAFACLQQARHPAPGCAAVKGYNRIHAILGQTDKGATSPETCIATNPSDMNVAMAALDASVQVEGPKGQAHDSRRHDFHRLVRHPPRSLTPLSARMSSSSPSAFPKPRFAKELPLPQSARPQQLRLRPDLSRLRP